MSLKRKTKLEHCNSPRGQALKQINNQILAEENQLERNAKENEFTVLERMYEKMGKIMKAYAKLQEESRKKDEIIKQLENENLMLKQRIVEKSEIGDSRLSKSRSSNSPKQGVVIQRTFTPIDIKKESTQLNQIITRPLQAYNPTASIINQYEPKLPSTKLLRQSRSYEHLSRTTRQIPTQRQDFRKMTIQMSKIEKKSIFASQKVNENKFSSQLLQDDKSFLDVLNKLKEKIKKFDQEDGENSKKSADETPKKIPNIIPPQESILNEFQPLTLSKAKSSQNFARKSNLKQSRHRQQMQALKKIWDQRDNQIKRMDDLFSKIDQRINNT